MLEYCANLELHPPPRGWAPLSGRIHYLANPGLKPWAVMFSRFAALSAPAEIQ
jgi:hypothetical protein